MTLQLTLAGQAAANSKDQGMLLSVDWSTTASRGGGGGAGTTGSTSCTGKFRGNTMHEQEGGWQDEC